LGHPSAARAADVLVLGHDGQVTVRNEPLPFALTSPPTPVPSVASYPSVGGRQAVAASASAVRNKLARLEAIHAISSAAYKGYISSFNAALRADKRLRGTRRAELQAVISNLHQRAVEGLLTTSRLPALFLTLNRNLRWWTTGPVPAPGQIVSFAGDEIDWEYYAGQGLEIQELGSFGKASWLFNHGSKHYAQGGQLMGELISIASHRAGGLTWEYYFNFDGGAPPWTSAMSQGTALQALANGYRATGNSSYLAIAQRALPLFRTRPPAGVAAKTRRGIRFVQYSFDPPRRDEVINAFLQALIGLNDYANISGNAVAEHLFQAGNAEAEHEVPDFDTGRWSLYQPGQLDPISYHELVTGFLQQLCRITNAQVYCVTAEHFQAYLKHPPPGVSH
jgi:hypothetical protein